MGFRVGDRGCRGLKSGCGCSAAARSAEDASGRIQLRMRVELHVMGDERARCLRRTSGREVKGRRGGVRYFIQ